MNEFLGVQLDEAGPDLINFISKLEQGAIDTVGWSWSTTDWFTFTCLQINIKTCEKVSPMLCVHLIDVVTNPSDLSAIYQNSYIAKRRKIVGWTLATRVPGRNLGAGI